MYSLEYTTGTGNTITIEQQIIDSIQSGKLLLAQGKEIMPMALGGFKTFLYPCKLLAECCNHLATGAC